MFHALLPLENFVGDLQAHPVSLGPYPLLGEAEHEEKGQRMEM